ncbi:hypothetical protein MUDAN_BIHEEGNE_03397 [Lactiplantibacillus mudanjiangensis]|uniref:hypothetical protein n=1 Tax=Lactiplantibacillus mudanjiangensis TaxID=1296538 RepID=UPI001015B0B4|nr:hypothetical protein MUDAN_BIHEEGNE_03397 [Lactiplantibacillus mudanjiangensis]
MRKLVNATYTDSDEIAIDLGKQSTFNEINFVVAHIADYTIQQWAYKNKMTVSDARNAYLAMLDSNLSEMESHDN